MTLVIWLRGTTDRGRVGMEEAAAATTAGRTDTWRESVRADAVVEDAGVTTVGSLDT